MENTEKELTGRDLRILADNYSRADFNYIQLEVIKTCDEYFYENITQDEPDYEDFLNNYNAWDEFWAYFLDENDFEGEARVEEREFAEKQIKEKGFDQYLEEAKAFCEQHESFEGYQDDKRDGNYPMWNTLFEFRDEPTEEILKAATDAGFGVISEHGHFNTMLFVAGAGYSFYAQHWIPMFLNLPWNDKIKEQYKGVKYEDQ